MGLMIDSSVLIAAERGVLDLPAFFAAHAEEAFFLAAVTAAELLYGVEVANTAKRRALRGAFVEGILTALPVIEYDLPIARSHARLWAKLTKAGLRIGAYDQQIAATALTFDHELATLNRGEFERVHGLRLADMTPFFIKSA